MFHPPQRTHHGDLDADNAPSQNGDKKKGDNFLRNSKEYIFPRVFIDFFQIFSDFYSKMIFLENSKCLLTLDTSRLKIISRSVDSDLESTSETKQNEIAFSE